MYVNKTQIYKFNGNDNNPPDLFRLRSFSEDFRNNEVKLIGLKGVVYEFYAKYCFINIENILNIYEYLWHEMILRSIK